MNDENRTQAYKKIFTKMEFSAAMPLEAAYRVLCFNHEASLTRNAHLSHLLTSLLFFFTDKYFFLVYSFHYDVSKLFFLSKDGWSVESHGCKALVLVRDLLKSDVSFHYVSPNNSSFVTGAEIIAVNEK